MDSAFQTISDAQLGAVLVYGEARGEPRLGQAAVLWVAKNRAAHKTLWPSTIHGVILQPKQFSCFLQSDPNYPQLLAFAKNSSTIPAQFLLLASEVFSGQVADPTGGAVNYHADTIIKDGKRIPLRPSWTKNLEFTVQIGRHLFYRLKKGA